MEQNDKQISEDVIIVNNNSICITKKGNHDYIRPSLLDSLPEPTLTVKTIYENNTYTWVQDDMINNCYNCDILFTWYVRKHHCRSCGRIFCYYCSKKRIQIPIEISKCSESEYWFRSIENFIKWNDGIMEKVCDQCYNEIIELNKVQKLITIFKNFDIRQLKTLSAICTSWNKASQYWLSKIKHIQNKLPTTKLTNMEKEILWRNKHFFGGHSKWLLQIIKSIHYGNYRKMFYLTDLIKQNKKYKCSNILCSNKCNEFIEPENILELLSHHIENDTIRKYLIECLEKAPDDEFICYIPFLIYNLKYDFCRQSYLLYHLIKRSKQSSNILSEVYWGFISMIQDMKMINNEVLERYYCMAKKCLEDELDEINKKKILNTVSTINHLNTILSKSTKQTVYKNIKTCKELNKKFYFPINFPDEYQCIVADDIIIKRSNSKPLIIPLKQLTEDGKTNISKILYKSDDIRKDLIISKIIKLINILLKKEENLDVDIISYSVVPIGVNQGIIEIIDNAKTIQEIKDNGFTIQNYIIENNVHLTVKEIREKFTTSSAAYCVISYILGFGDRHLDNIMISNSGSLFHIDFDYILGLDPKYSPQSLRITPDMLDAMGGYESKNYQIFKKLCVRIHNCIRKHIGVIMNMLTLTIKYDNNITLKLLRNEIIKRLEPGKNIIETKIHLENMIEKNYQTYTATVTDYIHENVKKYTFGFS